jgi:hypothetical protein
MSTCANGVHPKPTMVMFSSKHVQVSGHGACVFRAVVQCTNASLLAAKAIVGGQLATAVLRITTQALLVLSSPTAIGGVKSTTRPAPLSNPLLQFASARKKKAERNSQWHHQTPLLTEKRFQAANRSWTKRQLQAVVIFFIGRFVQNPSCSCCSP